MCGRWIPATKPWPSRVSTRCSARFAKNPGFVSAHVLETDDHASIAAIVEMKSAEDRQRLEQSGDVRKTLDHLHGAANLVVRLYHEAASYGG